MTTSHDTYRIEKRFSLLMQVYNELYEDDRYNLDQRMLLNAVIHYFREIDCKKAIDQIAHTDRHKQAAYTIKWISKIKPIQIVKELPDKYDTFWANAKFGILAGLSFLSLNIASIPDEFLAHLARLANYRDLDIDLLSSYMYLLEKVANQENL